MNIDEIIPHEYMYMKSLFAKTDKSIFVIFEVWPPSYNTKNYL